MPRWPNCLSLSLWAALIQTVQGAAAGIEGILYQTSFEANEAAPFVQGGLDGQNQWSIQEGSAIVQRAIRHSGDQAIRGEQASFKLQVSGNASVVWLDVFILDPGANQPMIPLSPISSMVFFSAPLGILALDGDGQGHGNFVQLQSNWIKGEFLRLSVRQDFLNKTYDVWINGALARQGLGFKDSVALSAIERQSSQASYLDDLSVTTWGLDADTDQDGLVDLDEVKFYQCNPLVADSDGDGMNDGAEILAGTDPSEARSLFSLRIASPNFGEHEIRIPTVTGRLYTLQRSGKLESDAWMEVPGAAALVGNGEEQVLARTNDGTNCFYRAVVTQ